MESEYENRIRDYEMKLQQANIESDNMKNQIFDLKKLNREKDEKIDEQQW